MNAVENMKAKSALKRELKQIDAKISEIEALWHELRCKKAELWEKLDYLQGETTKFLIIGAIIE